MTVVPFHQADLVAALVLENVRAPPDEEEKQQPKNDVSAVRDDVVELRHVAHRARAREVIVAHILAALKVQLQVPRDQLRNGERVEDTDRKKSEPEELEGSWRRREEGAFRVEGMMSNEQIATKFLDVLH